MADFYLKGFDAAFTAVPGIDLNAPLVDGGTDDSTVIDLGAEQPEMVALEMDLDGSSASNTDFVNVYAYWSKDSGGPVADDFNGVGAGAVLMNGTTAVQKAWTINTQGRYLILRAANNSGANLAGTGNAFSYAKIYSTSV